MVMGCSPFADVDPDVRSRAGIELPAAYSSVRAACDAVHQLVLNLAVRVDMRDRRHLLHERRDESPSGLHRRRAEAPIGREAPRELDIHPELPAGAATQELDVVRVEDRSVVDDDEIGSDSIDVVIRANIRIGRGVCRVGNQGSTQWAGARTGGRGWRGRGLQEKGTVCSSSAARCASAARVLGDLASTQTCAAPSSGARACQATVAPSARSSLLKRDDAPGSEVRF